MPPPSVQLLCALRGTEYIRTALAGVRPTLRTRTPPHSSPSPSAAAAAARFPSFHIRTRGLSSRRVDDDDRGPASSEETQTDFTALNVLADSPPPATAIDACLPDGFHLGNGLKITAGGGCLLVGGEAFSWRPWLAAGGTCSMINRNGQWDVHRQAWALLDLAWPKPGKGTTTHTHTYNSLAVFFFFAKTADK